MRNLRMFSITCRKDWFINSSFELLICVFLSLVVASEKLEKCHQRDPGFHLYLGTKTPYRTIANYDDKPLEYAGCFPTRFFGIIRHGTRTPGKKFIDKIHHLNLLKLSGRQRNKNVLCKDEAKRLKNWNLSLEIEGEKMLTHEGKDEMIELAERFRNRFPSLMSSKYSNTTYFFRYTDTQRTRESAKYFTVGLFGQKISRYVWFPQPIYGDPILRFYKLCKRWQKTVKKNPAAKKELEKFTNQNEAVRTCTSVSKRLGLNYTLSYDEVQLMYTVCSYETAWNKHATSPWCSVFSKSDLKVLEYAEDLKYYWIDGYGYDLNHQQACPVIQDVFSHLRNGTKAPVVFYFTHSGTLLKLISHLGLYKDNFVLSHDTHPILREIRQWRVSLVDSFGTNLAFVLYNCSGESKVLILHQERIVNLPGCPKNEPCPISHLEDLFKYSLVECDFSSMCSVLEHKN